MKMKNSVSCISSHFETGIPVFSNISKHSYTLMYICKIFCSVTSVNLFNHAVQ